MNPENGPAEEPDNNAEDEKMPLSPKMNDLSLTQGDSMEISSSQIVPLSNSFLMDSSSSAMLVSSSVLVDPER